MSQRIYLIAVIVVACLHILNWVSYDGVLIQWNHAFANVVTYVTPSDLGEMTTEKPQWNPPGNDTIDENQVESEGDASAPSLTENSNDGENQVASEGDTPNPTYDDKIENATVAPEEDVSTANATYHDNTEMNEVASEGDVSNPNTTYHDSNKTNQVTSARDIGKSSATRAEKWEKLWRHRIEVHSNSSENVSGKERQNILESFNATLTATSAQERGALTKLFDAFPVPKDSIALYNEDAYNQLISKLLLSQAGGRKFKIVATGGSTTAGGGRPPVAAGERYFGRFVDYLKNLLSINTGIECMDEGHGTRNSLHAAALFDEFIPSDADLLIWEFSINDAADPDLKNKEKILDTARQSFIAWLHEVSSMEKPPFVMLVYYWDSPYHRNETTRAIISNSFESHGDIARQFGFVVGHANMAAYVDELKLPRCGIFRRCPLLSDRHHASKLGHTATAFVLLNMLSPDVTFPASANNQTFSSDVAHVWECGTETLAKKVLKNVITNSSTGWKSSIGSWTLEIPFFDQQSSTRRLVPAHPLNEIEVIGKESLIRIDRQRVTSLGFCSKDFVSLKAPSKPMKDVRVIFLSFQTKIRLMKTEDIRVQINGSNATAPGELVPMVVHKEPSILTNWPCHFACTCAWGNNVDLYWYVFQSTQPAVHSVSLCATSEMRKPPKIQSIAFW